MADEALVSSAGGFEQELEGRPQLGCDLAVIRDEDADEDCLVHLAPELGVRAFVGAIEVRHVCKSPFEVRLDGVELQFQGAEPFFDVVEFPGDAFLLDPEELERDRSCVVRFE